MWKGPWLQSRWLHPAAAHSTAKFVDHPGPYGSGSRGSLGTSRRSPVMGSQTVRVGIHGWDPGHARWKMTRPWRASSTIEPPRRSAGAWRRKEDVGTKPWLLKTAPSMGVARWKARNRERKWREETRRRQRLQTSAARTGLAGSSGRERMRTSSTSSSSSCVGGVMLLGWLEGGGGARVRSGGGGGGGIGWRTMFSLSFLLG
ncbi:hypothetical protein HU200_016413 [Digitaria exilis]|uniref:Uncharacterized protein n=1 Tax=Digitaria exilis TaxID=1010633 RepID=A0A835F8G7_9POAL|nr:hypothetical protein HU200_016413 [Digitaria exilis]